MITLLEVYWDRTLIGQLWLNNEDMQFAYNKDWLNNPKALPISFNLPLQEKPFSSRKVKIFFCNLLPEEDLRKRLSKKYGVSEDNYFGFLEKIGGECAGALSVIPKNYSPSQSSSYQALSHQELNSMIDNRMIRPLIMARDDIRMSLAGAQDKLPVFFEKNHLYLPIGFKPSSHILKPPSSVWPDTVINEMFCMTLAKRAGLNVPAVTIYNTDKHLCYLIERYDRIMKNQTLNRIHQEDFCQALGLMPSQKYQADGSHVSLKKCFEFIKTQSSYPQADIIQMIKWVLFNFTIGNCDAHAKNLSLLIHKNGAYKLAPFYDILSTQFYNHSKKMAMKIGGDDSIKGMEKHRWEKFAKEISIPPSLLRELILELNQSIQKNIEPLVQEIQAQWAAKTFIKKLQKLVIQRSTALSKIWD